MIAKIAVIEKYQIISRVAQVISYKFVRPNELQFKSFPVYPLRRECPFVATHLYSQTHTTFHLSGHCTLNVPVLGKHGETRPPFRYWV